MNKIPDNPKIYHITHIENLPWILRDGMIWSDAERIAKGVNNKNIGMNKIKQRRLDELEIKCCAGRKVGEFVPFNFCPRSVMLFILDKGNHIDLSYHDGQQPLVHLECDLLATIKELEKQKTLWAFSDRNASSSLAKFYKHIDGLKNLSWDSIFSNDFRDSVVKEFKQAEFLIHQCFSWALVEKIGVINTEIQQKVSALIQGQKSVEVKPDWYY